MTFNNWTPIPLAMYRLRQKSHSPHTHLHARLLPEERYRASGLNVRRHFVVEKDHLLCLDKVCYVAIVIAAAYIESKTTHIHLFTTHTFCIHTSIKSSIPQHYFNNRTSKIVEI